MSDMDLWGRLRRLFYFFCALKYGSALCIAALIVLTLFLTLYQQPELLRLCLSVFALLTFLMAAAGILYGMYAVKKTRFSFPDHPFFRKVKYFVYADFAVLLISSVVAALHLGFAISVGALLLSGMAGIALMLDFIVGGRLLFTLFASRR